MIRGAILVIGVMCLGQCPKGNVAPAEDAAPVAMLDASPQSDDPASPTSYPANPIDAQKNLDAAVQGALAPQPNCAALASDALFVSLVTAHPDNAFFVTNKPSIISIAQCADKIGAFRFMLALSSRLLDADPSDGHPELVARALEQTDEVDTALVLLEAACHAHPNDAALWLALANTETKIAHWKEAIAHADASLNQLGSVDSPNKREAAWKAHECRGRALLHQGLFDQATKESDAATFLGAPSSALADLTTGIANSRTSKTIVEVRVESHVPLSAYRVMTSRVRPLARVTITNADAVLHHYRVDTTLSTVTDTTTKTASVDAGRRVTLLATPPLARTFDDKAQTADRAGTIEIHVSMTDEAEKKVFDEVAPVTLLGNDGLLLTSEFVSAWVDPRALGLDALIASARKRAPHVGPSQIYDELRARGFVVNHDAFVVDETSLVARARKPNEVLASKSGNLLEGVLLYASALEAAFFQPMIVIRPGHVYVGWRPLLSDPVPPTGLSFIELSNLVDDDFSTAVSKGLRAYQDDRSAHHFDLYRGGGPIAAIVDIVQRHISANATGKCTGGRTWCGGACVDLQKGLRSRTCLVCGDCDQCGSPEDDQCKSGKILPQSCAPKENACSPPDAPLLTTCANFETDRHHCGACDHRCLDTQTCVNGGCKAPACKGNTRNCEGVCIDMDNSSNNCGECGHGCPSQMTCGHSHCEWVGSH